MPHLAACVNVWSWHVLNAEAEGSEFAEWILVVYGTGDVF